MCTAQQALGVEWPAGSTHTQEVELRATSLPPGRSGKGFSRWQLLIVHRVATRGKPVTREYMLRRDHVSEVPQPLPLSPPWVDCAPAPPSKAVARTRKTEAAALHIIVCGSASVCVGCAVVSCVLASRRAGEK